MWCTPRSTTPWSTCQSSTSFSDASSESEHVRPFVQRLHDSFLLHSFDPPYHPHHDIETLAKSAGGHTEIGGKTIVKSWHNVFVMVEIVFPQGARGWHCGKVPLVRFLTSATQTTTQHNRWTNLETNLHRGRARSASRATFFPFSYFRKAFTSHLLIPSSPCGKTNASIVPDNGTMKLVPFLSAHCTYYSSSNPILTWCTFFTKYAK